MNMLVTSNYIGKIEPVSRKRYQLTCAPIEYSGQSAQSDQSLQYGALWVAKGPPSLQVKN